METLAAPEETTKEWVPKYAGLTMPKADFLKWESDDVFVYEFNDGILEPTLGMKSDEKRLVKRLTRRFSTTEAYQQGGELMPEADCWLTENQMRRPDLSFYTEDQINQSDSVRSVIPTFVIELISEYDEILRIQIKLREYFEAGVKVVWWVFPTLKTIEVYTSPKTVLIASDADPISAAPALPDFTMTVEDLFRLD